MVSIYVINTNLVDIDKGRYFYGFPHESILGPLLFNIDICDFFIVDITSGIVNYAEDTTPYECDQHCNNMISNLEVAVIKFSVGLSIIV